GLTMDVAPEMHERCVSFCHPQRIGPAQQVSALIKHADDDISGLLHAQPLHHGSKGARRKSHPARQAGNGAIALQPQRTIDQVGWVAPLVLRLDRQAEWLARAHKCGNYRTPVHTRAGGDGNFRAQRQRYIVIGGDRIGEDAELEFRLAVGLHADAWRTKAAVTEPNDYAIAGAKKIPHHPDIKRAAPGADIALELPFGLKRRAVGCLHSCVTLALRIGELDRPEVGGEAESDLDGARIVDTKGAGAIN